MLMCTIYHNTDSDIPHMYLCLYGYAKFGSTELHGLTAYLRLRDRQIFPYIDR